jgi:branched-chain amino acid transport system substrate-binding protein
MAHVRIRTVVAAVGAASLLLTACNGDTDTDTGTTDADAEEADEAADDADEEPAEDPDDGDEPTADGDPIRVGVITSTSGLLGAYGNAYLDGLAAGLDYATDGTGAVDGRPVEFEIVDDAGEPDTAISAGVDLVGQGITILAGSVSSGVAVQMAPFAEENQVLFISGPAATDAVTGINGYTFRSGRQSYQDVAAAASLVDDIDGSTVVAFVQDSEFGAANIGALEAVLGEQGATIEAVEVPISATEFTPFVQQVSDIDPDLVFVAWAGDTTPAMWEAMEQQAIFENYAVTTGLGDVATWPLYGPAGPDIQFLSHYYSTAPDNEVNDAMVDAVGADQTDLFTPDGFVAAQMIVRALTEAGPDDVEGMIGALEGWEFDGPKGPMTIRASDHAMLQPMFTASMQNVDDDPSNIEVETLESLNPEATAPPEAG